ncbi:hypothetical protein MAM1_0032d02455 [Mucor ambiguus]|uniref:Kinesin motor domain-containing protein n=1 Tax=Mucor ambiguus TaxID=91626 RepID=A0A0C9LSN7_9FUNG|nr:hypothetical protein MAM1_0032d02455 [Mucor ambiguus]
MVNQRNSHDLGIVPLSFETVFESIKNDTNHEFILSLSCFEITNEVIRDLFSEQGEALKISDENKRRGAYVMSLREQIITSPMEALQYIKRAEGMSLAQWKRYTIEKREKQAAAMKLSASSNISIVSSTSSSTSSSSRRTRVPQKKRNNVQISYLYLIDMASNDKSIFQTLKSPINKSCLAFEAVVYNLSEAGKSAGHPLPPYHDSKLTRLLQPAFMGQHHVVSICTVDMESASQDEIPTLDILSFASRIKRIPVSPKPCEVSDERSLLIKYSNNFAFLTLKLEKLDRDQAESSTDLSSIRSVIKQRLHNASRLILSSQSVIQNHLSHVEDEHDDPWRVISQLRQEFDTLAADKDTQLGQLKSVMEETRSLPDEIAQLEAELNITRAELQVTQLLVNEASSPSALHYAK